MSENPPQGECRLYLPGHRVHPIQARKAAAAPGAAIHSVAVEAEVIVLHTSNAVWRCRSHNQLRLLRLARERLPEVRLVETWGVLRIGRGSVRDLISISTEPDSWTYCRDTTLSVNRALRPEL